MRSSLLPLKSPALIVGLCCRLWCCTRDVSGVLHKGSDQVAQSIFLLERPIGNYVFQVVLESRSCSLHVDKCLSLHRDRRGVNQYAHAGYSRHTTLQQITSDEVLVNSQSTYLAVIAILLALSFRRMRHASILISPCKGTYGLASNKTLENGTVCDYDADSADSPGKSAFADFK